MCAGRDGSRSSHRGICSGLGLDVGQCKRIIIVCFFRFLFVLMVHTEIIKPHYVLNFEFKYVAIPAIVLLSVYTALHPQPVSDSILCRDCALRLENLVTSSNWWI